MLRLAGVSGGPAVGHPRSIHLFRGSTCRVLGRSLPMASLAARPLRRHAGRSKTCSAQSSRFRLQVPLPTRFATSSHPASGPHPFRQPVGCRLFFRHRIASQPGPTRPVAAFSSQLHRLSGGKISCQSLSSSPRFFPVHGCRSRPSSGRCRLSWLPAHCQSPASVSALSFATFRVRVRRRPSQSTRPVRAAGSFSSQSHRGHHVNTHSSPAGLFSPVHAYGPRHSSSPQGRAAVVCRPCHCSPHPGRSAYQLCKRRRAARGGHPLFGKIPHVPARQSNRSAVPLHHAPRGVHMRLGIAGTRHHSPAIQQAVNRLLSCLPSWCTVFTGCCPSGVDSYVRSAFPVYLGPGATSGLSFFANGRSPANPRLVIFSASAPTAAALRARTIRLVQACHVLVAFPSSESFIHSGTWLAIHEGANVHGRATFVVLPPSIGPGLLPRVRGIVSWRSAALPGSLCAFRGYRIFSPVTSQLTLF